MATPVDTTAALKRKAARERRAMFNALVDWFTLKAGPPGGAVEDLAPLEWEAACEWARRAWYLHHAARRPFAEKYPVFPPNHWQAQVREGIHHRRFLEAVRAPLPAITFGDEPQAKGAVHVPEVEVPEAVGRAIGTLADKDADTVIRYIAQLHVREGNITVRGLLSFHEGARDALPPARGRGPASDATLERYLHLGHMVANLMRRGLKRTRNDASPLRSASDAVEQAAGVSLTTLETAWRTFRFIEEHAGEARAWPDLFARWKAWKQKAWKQNGMSR